MIANAIQTVGSALGRAPTTASPEQPTVPGFRPHTVASGLKQRIDLVSVMVTVIIAGVVGYVGINIMSNTEQATGLQSGDAFYASQGNLTDGLQQFFSQIGTVFVVIVLVVVIGYLMLLRGR